MTRSSQRFFGRAACVLGLLFVSPLAYAAQLCVSVPSLASDSQAAPGECCRGASPQPALCVVSTQRNHVGASATTSPSTDALAGTDAPYHAAGIPFPIVQLRSPTGVAPGFPPPVHILFGRYLS